MADVTDPDGGHAGEGAGDYCREVEAYLCRKNDGHLIRIAGPSFARVCGWAERGIPLNVVFRGIDRYFERYYSRGPRRRPVHIDFCEDDVLDVFDEWRRAVGVHEAGRGTAGPADIGSGEVRAHHPRASLPAHLERVIVRLTTLRAGARFTAEADAAIAAAIRELEAARAGAAHLRGDARSALVARLREIDLALIGAVRQSIGGTERQAIEREAQEELAPFKGGMTGEAYQHALEASATRLLRERTGLPVVAYDE